MQHQTVKVKDEWLEERDRVRAYIDAMLAEAEKDDSPVTDGEEFFKQMRAKYGF